MSTTEAGNAFEILTERGFFYQTTDEAALKAALTGKSVTFYVGFDPTGSSLHVGHLLPAMAMRWLQRCGHRPIALVGGATAMVGDPSGKSDARPILTLEEIDANARAIQTQLALILDFTDDRALMVNNADWLRNVNYIEFLRDVGRNFSVNRMLSAESVKMRLNSDAGLSFLEFNYTLLQAYDFYILRRDRDCTVQFGGQDQWGNIVAGIDLTRRMLGQEVHGATFPLLLKSDGEKFGKTAAGAVWLDPQRTSPYEYYQFWRNAADADLRKLLAFFTALPMEEVNRLSALQPPTVNRAKEILAYEATATVHGHDLAAQAYVASGREFGFADPRGTVPTSSPVATVMPDDHQADIPTHEVTRGQVEAGLGVLALLRDSGLCTSNGEARRLIRGGGAYLNDTKVTDEHMQVTHDLFTDNALLLRAGKKKLRRIVLA